MNPLHSATRLLAAFTVVWSGAVAAQPASTYPNAPIRIVISTPPGGGNDVVARLIGQKLTAAWGQPVIVDSKPGASGLIAGATVAKAPPDGYTLLVTHAALATALALKSNPIVHLSELQPVMRIADTPIAFTVGTSTGAKTLAEFVAVAKGHPKKMSYGSYGVGTSAHLLGEMLNRRAGIDLLHVPYKGEAPAVTDLLGGQVSAIFGSAGVVGPHVKSGKAVIVAFANPKRVSAFPDVPTFAEAGYPDLNVPGWIGLFAPTGTPKPIVDKLAAELGRVVQMPDVQQRIVEMGYEPSGTATRAFADQLDAEIGKWAALGKEAGISLD